MTTLNTVSFIFFLVIALQAQEYDSGLMDLVVEGGGSILETDATPDRFVDYAITFNSRFVILPSVAVGYIKYKVSNHVNAEIGFLMTVSAITLRGFALRVTYHDTYPLHKLAISWIATNDPNVLIEHEDITDSTAIPTASGSGYRDYILNYFPASMTYGSNSKTVAIVNGYRVISTALPWNFGALYVGNPPAKILWVRETTCIRSMSVYFITSNRVQPAFSGDIRATSFGVTGFLNMVVNYGNIGSSQNIITGTMETWAYGTGDLDVELKNIQFTDTQYLSVMGQATPANSLAFLGYAYMIFKQCTRIFSECAFQGTEITVCALDAQTQTVTGSVRSLILVSGKQIIFFSVTGSSQTITSMKYNKKRIHQTNFQSFAISSI